MNPPSGSSGDEDDDGGVQLEPLVLPVRLRASRARIIAVLQFQCLLMIYQTLFRGILAAEELCLNERYETNELFPDQQAYFNAVREMIETLLQRIDRVMRVVERIIAYYVPGAEPRW
ncbi:hypothetical protein FQN57_002534 [Myotisia sp. PD_48]|nr:hypothetical protein FQN57_002534 [Myotisia sp. PD_48]